MTRHLFFYGVLLGEVASDRIAAMLAGIGPGNPAIASGVLYAVIDRAGSYPVLLPGEGEVRGAVHEVGSVDLAVLDRFEGVDPNDPRAGEYRREAIRVIPATGSPLEADAYLYNHAPGPALVPIRHGDFARWLRETGNQPLAG